MKKLKVWFKNPLRQVTLTKAEIDSLKQFADDNLERGAVDITQTGGGGLGWITKVQVQRLPETLTDITDVNSW